jgi:hypothetical protein
MSNDPVLEGMFVNFVESALAKDYVFESPRDDEVVAHAVSRWQWIIAVWCDPSSPNGYKMDSISGFAELLSGSQAYVRSNALLVANEATARKWKAIHTPQRGPN